MFDEQRAKLVTWARALKSEITVLALAVRDPRTPLLAKMLGVFIVAYALSPVDLIPDFIPVIGFLDELILLPVCLWALKRMIPAHVLDEHRALVGPEARLPLNKYAAAVIVAIWLVVLAAVSHWLWQQAGKPWIS